MTQKQTFHKFNCSISLANSMKTLQENRLFTSRDNSMTFSPKIYFCPRNLPFWNLELKNTLSAREII